MFVNKSCCSGIGFVACVSGAIVALHADSTRYLCRPRREPTWNGLASSSSVRNEVGRWQVQGAFSVRPPHSLASQPADQQSISAPVMEALAGQSIALAGASCARRCSARRSVFVPLPQHGPAARSRRSVQPGNRLRCAAVASSRPPDVPKVGGKAKPVQTPHSGYHDDGFPRRFFEGWCGVIPVGRQHAPEPISQSLVLYSECNVAVSSELLCVEKCDHRLERALIHVHTQVLASHTAQGDREPELCPHLLC